MPNALAQEKSPYLLQHADNPVGWLPWGEKAFEKARVEQKPIFLSIGYSTCHWCHVMAHESFEDPRIAQLLNRYFVSIKVDREERPDVDRVYMSFVQATTGSGGWPMSVFLTPELKPFVGGTYFPPEDRYNRPRFATVLTRIAEAWEQDQPKIIEQGDSILAALQPQSTDHSGTLNFPAILQNGFEQIARTFDPEFGGFGRAPKFPHPVSLNFFFREWHRTGNFQALEMSLKTLRAMARGGIHDQLGGGFHRYSVDRFWHIPHFEKMLYDQGLLATAYLEAFQITREPEFEKVACATLDYVRDQMWAEGFYSAEDADSLLAHGSIEHGEGAFYIWSKEEIDRLLGPDAALFNFVYGVEVSGNAPDGSDPHGEFTGKNTLLQRHTVDEAATHFRKSLPQITAALDAAKRVLLQARSQRPRPHLDDKIITAWNGLMISAFARAAQLLQREDYLQTATEAARFVATHLKTSDGRLLRSYREGPSAVEGFADDYTFFIQSLLDLYEAGFDFQWLRLAEELQAVQDRLFADPEQGGYFSVRAEATDILIRSKEEYDGAEPSASSVAASNLLRLAQFTGDQRFAQAAEKVFLAFAHQLERLPQAMPQLLASLAVAQQKPLQIVIAGNPHAADTRALLGAVHKVYLPQKALLLADGGEGQQWLSNRLEFLKTAKPIEGKACAYVCVDFVCQLPTSDPEVLARVLGEKARKLHGTV